jgi:hypothetical protein
MLMKSFPIFRVCVWSLLLSSLGTAAQAAFEDEGSCGYANWYAADKKGSCESDWSATCVRKDRCGSEFCGSGAARYCWKPVNGTPGYQDRFAVEPGAIVAPGPTPTPTPATRPDFNGDGASDIVWRKGNETKVLLLGPTQTEEALVALPDAWKMVGLADFNGDGKTDLLWRDETTGGNYAWLMDGTTKVDGASLPQVAELAWRIAGSADFNGDKSPDVLWRKDVDGFNYLWFMDGTKLSGGGALPTVAVDWRIVGVGELNGDGKADIVWRRDTTGENYVWFMDGLKLVGGAGLPPLTSTAWALVGVGDFSGDGKSDLLWREGANGGTYVWEMDGTEFVRGRWLANAMDTTWTAVPSGF